MSKPPDLSHLSDAELEAELARRRVGAAEDADGYTVEVALEAEGHRWVAARLDAYFHAREQAQTTAWQPCPRCGRPCRVRRRWVVRTLRSLHGTHTVRRHYHYCATCQQGWYPLDAALGWPPEGELTARLEQVVLDLGLHDPFEEAAERFAVHHGQPISENLVRRVVDRVGRAAVADATGLARVRPAARTVPASLVVQLDGSMLPTRGADPWREAKVGVVARGEHFAQAKGRGLITEARFVARVGDHAGFQATLAEALALERADDCAHIVVVGDGAPWVWTLADALCPTALQVLDSPHAVQHATEAAQALFPPATGLDRLFVTTVERALLAGQIDELIHDLEACAFAARGRDRAALVALVRYYRTHRNRLRYDYFRARGVPCGSGAVESAHRHVLQKRMKLAGQHWDPVRADRLAQLRAALATCGPLRLYAAVRSDLRPTGSYN